MGELNNASFLVVVVVCFGSIFQIKDLSKNSIQNMAWRPFCVYKELSSTSVGKLNFWKKANYTEYTVAKLSK